MNCASYSPDGAFVLAAFLDCAARIWSLHKGERIHILTLDPPRNGSKSAPKPL